MTNKFQLLFFTMLEVALVLSFQVESKTKTLHFCSPLTITCLLIPLCLHFSCLTKGFSICAVMKTFFDSEKLRFCKRLCSFIFCWIMVVAWFIVNFVFVDFDSKITNPYSSDIIELISGSMMFVSQMILCDQFLVLVNVFADMVVQFNTNYLTKLWFLWSIIILASLEGNIDICVATVENCDSSSRHQPRVAIGCYVLSWFCIIFMICIYVCMYADKTQNSLDSNIKDDYMIFHDAKNKFIIGDEQQHRNESQSDAYVPFRVRVSSITAIKDSIKHIVERMSQHLSSVLLIVTASISAIGTMSLYLVIQHHINKLEQDYPFVKHRRPTPRPTHKPVSYPTIPPTFKPTVEPIKNVIHVELYIGEFYDRLQTYHSEQRFCWIACLIAVSVIVVVLRSTVNWKRMLLIINVL